MSIPFLFGLAIGVLVLLVSLTVGIVYAVKHKKLLKRVFKRKLSQSKTRVRMAWDWFQNRSQKARRVIAACLLLIALGIGIFILYQAVPWQSLRWTNLNFASEVAKTTETTPPAIATATTTETSYTVLWWLLGACGVVGFIFSVLFILYKKNNPKKRSTRGPTPTTSDDDEAPWPVRIKNRIQAFRDSTLLYPVLVTVGWFMAMAALKIFSDEMRAFGWPGRDMSAWEWLRAEHNKLIWITPFVLLVGILFVLSKNKLVRSPGYLIFLIIGLVWVSALWTGTRDSNLAETTTAYITSYSDQYAAEKAEKERKKKEAEMAYNFRQQEEFNAPVNDWSQAVVPNGWHCDVMVQKEVEVWVTYNNGKPASFFYDEPHKHTDYGDDRLISGIRFRGVHEPAPVKVSFRRY